MEIIQMKIGDIKPYEKNAKKHPQSQIEAVAKSINEFGFNQPLVVDKDSNLIVGHGRLEAAKLLGLQEVPVLIAKDLSEAQAMAYRLADNKLNESEWDMELVMEELGELQNIGFDIELTGFEVDLIVTPEVDEEDDVIPNTKNEDSVDIKEGDIYQLGEHRVMCGDATKMDDVEKLMNGELADCVWTDPPYNVDYEGKDGMKIKNDKMDNDSFYQFLYDTYVNYFTFTKGGAPIYVAHADTEGHNFRMAFVNAGFKMQGCLIWKKNQLVLGRADYQWQHEPILYGWNPSDSHKWYGGRKQTTVDFAKCFDVEETDEGTVVYVNGESLLIKGDNIEVTPYESSIILAEKPLVNKDHPTMKPIELINRMLVNSSRVGDLVLDLFGGSGSTLISCEKLQRRCNIMELDPVYMDVIIRRWEKLTNKKAIKLT